MIRILEVNSTDLMGSRYNGYDMIQILSDKTLDIKQAVVEKQSDNPKVIDILKNDTLREIHNKIKYYEEPNESIKNVLSVVTPSLMNTKEYKEADIIHLHMIHNSGLSLYSLIKMSQEKKLIITLHDPWLLTGRCVHFYDCDKWKSGCQMCEHLDTLFPLKEDKCNTLWKIKKQVIEKIDADYIIPTDWLYSLLDDSPIFKNEKRRHKIYFGLDLDKFASITYKEARKKLKIEEDEIVFFHRAQNEFKGTPYVLEALKEMEPNKKITILTCDGVGLLDEVKDKFNIRDLGLLKEPELITAMNACDIFLMPSIGENAGLMAVEAMACEKPVIIFQNTGLPFVTHAPECGYLVKNRDSKDLKKAMESLIKDKKEREKRGKLGKKIVQEEYTNEKYYDSLRKLYKEVYNRKKKEKRIEIKDTENKEQFKFYLNDLTVRFFGTSSKISKELMIQTKDIKRKKNYQYDYSDFSLLNLLEEYMEKLVQLIEKDNPKIENTTKIKIEKLLYLLRNNPSFIIRKLKKR